VERLVSAIFSPCRSWRYVLVRQTERGVALGMAQEFHRGKALRVPTVAFIGLNPSTADEAVNDPTVRRCIGFADRWGYARMVLVNLFAYRATDPKKVRDLATREVAIGPDNDEHLIREAMAADLVVAAWGERGGMFDRSSEVVGMLNDAEVHAFMLGMTRPRFPKPSEPRHPLYLRSDAALKRLPGQPLWFPGKIGAVPERPAGLR
jgi:hypothetical protein